MATEHIYPAFSMVANSDLSAKQYRFARPTGGNRKVDLCTATTQRPMGVIQNKPKAGQACAIGAYGITKLVAGGTIAVGDLVGPDTNSAAVTKTSANDIIAAVALTAAASGEIFEALLTPGCQRSN